MDRNLYGLDKLRTYVPDLAHPYRRFLIAAIPLTSFLIATFLMVGVDRLWPRWTGLGQIIIIAIGFGWTSIFFMRRHVYRAKWKRMAFRTAFGLHILPGLPVILAAVIHTAYVPGNRLMFGFPAMLTFLIGAVLFVSGIVLWVRSILTFGFDNLSMLYVYVPQNGRIVNSRIYSIIRHPVYTGVISIGISLGLWRGTLFSILFGLFMPVGLMLWINLIEEPELVDRFGNDYVKYRKRTPAFIPHYKKFREFIQFLLEGDQLQVS